MKKYSIILMIVLFVLVLSACGNTTKNSGNTSEISGKEELVYDSVEGFDYSDVEGGIIITYFKNYDYVEYDKIYVPEEIDGKPVIGIGAKEKDETYYGSVFTAIFGECEIIIPDSVRYIGGESFTGAGGLVKLSGGKNCKEIGEYAFLNCYNLKEITFLSNVTDLADNAFAGCTAWEANH